MKQLLHTAPFILLFFALNLVAGGPAYGQNLQQEKLEFAPMPDHTAQFEWVDADGDKDLDVLVFKLNAWDSKKTNIRLYENKAGRFEEVKDPFGGPVELMPLSYAFGDHDQDGDLDFLFRDNTTLRLAQNNGNLSFTLRDLAGFEPKYFAPNLQWLDVDGDADLDILYPHASPNNSLAVYLNHQGSFTPSPHPLSPMLSAFAFADVNNDGLPDFVAAKGQTTSNPVLLHLNRGDGSFEMAAEELVPGVSNGGKMLWADLDGDQDLDLFLTESNQKCTLLRNQFMETGVPRFERAYQFKESYYPLVDIGDINQDGLPDLVFSGQLDRQETTLLYLNQSSGTAFKFEEKDLKLRKTGYDLDLVDLNRDQALDLFFINREAATQAVAFELHKSTAATGLKLLPPANLKTAVQEQVLLSWDPVPAGGSFSYHLELKQNGQLYASSWSLDDGSPLWPQQPEKQVLPRRLLGNLPAGSYQWRVQTRDAAGRYSGFSDYQAFTIAAAPAELVLQQPELTRVRLQWRDNAPAGAGYAVFRRSANQVLERIATLPAGTTSYEDAGLMTNQQYEYLVKANLQGSLSAPSNVVSVSTPLFGEKTLSQPPPAFPGLGLSADLDQDDDYDLALMQTSGYNSRLGTLLQNDGTGTYTASELFPANQGGTQNFILRDMDNDGDEDICAAVGNYVVVYENANGLFRKAYTSRYCQVLVQLAVEDFNHDGRPDLLFSHTTTNNTNDDDYQLLLQDQAFTFLPAPYRFIPDNSHLIGRFAIGDLNNDGFADILFGGSALNQIKAKIFYSLGGNSFAPRETNFTGLDYFRLMDYNQDGYLDIVQNRDATPGLLVYEGSGDLSFREARFHEILNANMNNFTDIQADFDLNGYPDLLVAGSNYPVLLQSQGAGQYAPIVLQAGATGKGGRVTLTDFENDGDLDLHYDMAHTLFENKLLGAGTFTNHPPAAPAGLTVTLGAKTRISWSPATDDKSPAGALTYNLRLEDGAGKLWLHPETNAAGTFRRRLAPGNAGNKTSYELNDLPAGRYRVQVQALDAGFQLSAFSPALTFEILSGPVHLTLERLLLNKVKLSWQDTLAAETQLIVERRTAESDFAVIARLPPNSTSYTDEQLAYNQHYMYRVYALVNGQPTAPTNLVEWKTDLFVLSPAPGMPSLSNTWVEAGDYNNDTRMDLVVFGNPIRNGQWLPQEMKLLENTATGWVTHPINSGTLSTSQLQLADFNGDHRLDIFRYGFTNTLTRQSEIQFNQGQHSFQTGPSLFTSKPQMLLEWWDMDSDNDLDAVMSEISSSLPWYKRTLRNNGGGNFSTGEEISITCTGCSQLFFTGDFDRDGDEDQLQYAYTPEGGSGYYLLENNQGKLSQTQVVIPTESGSSIRVVDYNNDGWPDIFVEASTFDYWSAKSKLFKNQGLDAGGLPRFARVQDQLPAGDHFFNHDWVDFDHDGDLDFFTGDNFLSVYINEGNDRFSAFIPPSLSPFQSRGQLIDFDNDGDLDIYLRWKFDNSQGAVLLNQIVTDSSGIANQAPQPPASLSAVQDEKGLHLTWDPATDDLTPAAGLTYDVILYRDGKAITKAPLDPVSGNRQRLAFGRSPSRLTLQRLAVGAYTWKVQAVDASYRGSALSAAGSFFFKPEPPLVNDTLIYRCGREIALQAGGENIEWFQDAALSVKLAAGTFRPQASQQVYVTQTIGGVRGIAKKVAITILERPDKPVLAASNRYTYCSQSSGMGLYLQAAGENVRWYGDKELQNLVHNGPLFTAPAEEKTYYVTQTIQNCESAAAEAILRPVQVDARLYQSQDTLYAAEKSGLSYQWYLDNRILSWGSQNYIKLNKDGIYSVRIYKDGCWEKSPDLALNLPDPILTQEIRVYPNPAPGEVFVQVPVGARTVEIKVSDTLGRVVYQTSYQNNTGVPLPLPAKNWEKGLYYFHVITSQEQVVKKVFIK